MCFACRAYLAIAFICSSMFLLAGRAYSQIQFNPNPNLNYSPAVAPCESAVSAKIQADHGTQGHFTDRTRITRDMLGNARMQGSDGYLGTSFTFTCVIDEHTKTVALALYDEHVDAYEDFRFMRDNLNGGHRTTLNRLIPFCMFTDPELARWA